MASEAVVQQQVRLALAASGALMWRNQVGAFTDENGRVIRFGICNDSAQLNAQLKSSDLVGAVPVLITPAHVGRTLAVLTAVECKHSDWHITPGDKRAQAQLRFIDLVRSVGGAGGFATSADEAVKIVSELR